MSLAIFITEQATTLSAPCASTSASCAASASNYTKTHTLGLLIPLQLSTFKKTHGSDLIRRRLEFVARQLRNLSRDPDIEPFLGVQALNKQRHENLLRC